MNSRNSGRARKAGPKKASKKTAPQAGQKSASKNPQKSVSKKGSQEAAKKTAKKESKKNSKQTVRPASKPESAPALAGIAIADLNTVSSGHLITTAARVILRRYETRQRDCGVTPPRSGILLLLNMAGPLSQKEIAQHLFLDKTNLSMLIRDMERDRLVTIETSAKDRRVRVVCIAPAGRKLLPELQKINREISGELDARLTPDAARAMRAFFADFLIDEFARDPD